jgi:hypothetical protein
VDTLACCRVLRTVLQDQRLCMYIKAHHEITEAVLIVLNFQFFKIFLKQLKSYSACSKGFMILLTLEIQTPSKKWARQKVPQFLLQT